MFCKVIVTGNICPLTNLAKVSKGTVTQCVFVAYDVFFELSSSPPVNSVAIPSEGLIVITTISNQFLNPEYLSQSLPSPLSSAALLASLMTE
jgi:hypothetical protein